MCGNEATTQIPACSASRRAGGVGARRPRDRRRPLRAADRSCFPNASRLLREGQMLRELASSLRQMIVGLRARLPDRDSARRGDGPLAALRRAAPSVAVACSWSLRWRRWCRCSSWSSEPASGSVPRSCSSASIWYVMLTVYQGARGIEPRFIDVGRSFGASRWQAFRDDPAAGALSVRHHRDADRPRPRDTRHGGGRDVHHRRLRRLDLSCRDCRCRRRRCWRCWSRSCWWA